MTTVPTAPAASPFSGNARSSRTISFSWGFNFHGLISWSESQSRGVPPRRRHVSTRTRRQSSCHSPLDRDHLVVLCAELRNTRFDSFRRIKHDLLGKSIRVTSIESERLLEPFCLWSALFSWTKPGILRSLQLGPIAYPATRRPLRLEGWKDRWCRDASRSADSVTRWAHYGLSTAPECGANTAAGNWIRCGNADQSPLSRRMVRPVR